MVQSINTYREDYFIKISQTYIIKYHLLNNLVQIMEEKKPIKSLIDNIKTHVEQLNKLNDEIVKKFSHFEYPIRLIINFYQKDFIPKLTARQTKTHILSDILILWSHKLIGFVFLIQKYLSNLELKARKQIISFNYSSGSIRKSVTLTQIPNSPIISISTQNSWGQIPSSERDDKESEGTLESNLRIPQVFILKSIPNIVKEAIKYCEQIKDQRQNRSLRLFLTTLQRLTAEQNSIIQMKNKEVEEIQTIVKQSFYKDIQNPKKKVVLKFGYRLLFITKLKQRVKKANKRINERKMRIQQLIDGQKKYTEGLKDYIQYIKKPIQATGLATKEQLLKMFSTIEPILALHTHLLKQLNDNFANYSKEQTYGNILSKNFPYFKIYTDYIYYADQAQALLLKLSEQHEQIEQICSKFMREKQKKASDELKQPTFRIARYQMIIKQILKNTNPIHKDYSKLEQAKEVGINMLQKLNQIVDSTCRRDRLNQIQQEFGTQQRPIFAANREFLQEFQMIYIHEDKQESVTVHVFNDIVLVIQTELRKILKWIKIDENFYVRKQEDNKTYKNVIKVHSDGFMTFSAGTEEKHEKKAEDFFNLLQRVSKQNEQNNKIVYVQVIGTEQIGSTSFAKHTEYVIQIKYLGLRKLVHLRFSQMQPLVTRVQNHYEDDLNISYEQALKKNWFNNHKSKTIEDRKRTIQQILQKLLNHELVKKNPQFILQQLKIQGSFFRKTQQYKKKRLSMKHQDSNNEKQVNSPKIEEVHSSLKSSMLKSKKKQYKEAETILCATQIKLGRDLFHDIEEGFVDLKKTEAEKIEIKIHTMVQQEPCVVSITQYYTVEDISNKVSKIIGLRMNRDFRLFHEIGKKELRVLDQEQKLVKIFNFQKNQNKIGFVSQIVDSIKKIVTPSQHPKLVYKKYYFLPIQIEQSECRKDLTRLRLIVYQIFSQIKQMKYQLSFDQYLLFLAMLIYIQFDGDVPANIDESYVDKIIPQTIFKLKNYTQQQWIEKCRLHITRLSEQINKIIQYNRQQLKLKKIKADSISKTALHFGKRHLCSQIVINKIKSNIIFGSNLFYVQPYKKTFQKLANQGKKMAYNMWLAIKVEGLNLLTPSSKQTVFELKYKDIQKIFVFSESITFKMVGLQTCEYRLNTYQSFEISQLVKYNKCLNDTLLQLERNQDLIMKARMYKQQCLIYRNSYNQPESHIKEQVQT